MRVLVGRRRSSADLELLREQNQGSRNQRYYAKNEEAIHECEQSRLREKLVVVPRIRRTHCLSMREAVGLQIVRSLRHRLLQELR